MIRSYSAQTSIAYDAWLLLDDCCTRDWRQQATHQSSSQCLGCGLGGEWNCIGHRGRGLKHRCKQKQTEKFCAKLQTQIFLVDSCFGAVFFCISATTIVAFFPGLARRGSDNSSVSGLSSNGPSLKNRPKNIGDQMKEKLRACEMCNVRHGEKNARATGYFRITFHVIRLNHVTQAGANGSSFCMATSLVHPHIIHWIWL